MPDADARPVPYRITVVCLGNICRSPIGEAVLRARIADAGLSEQVAVDSAGTGDWHLGHPADPRALATLDAAGYPHDHIARQIAPHWMDGIDLLLAMDEANYADLAAMLPRDGSGPELRMMRSFDPALAHLPEPHPDLAVPDPYYGGPEGFVEVLHMIEEAADGLVDDLLADRLDR
jgi:protein-tyrosine phosphatase